MKIFASAFFSIILSLIFIFNIYSKDESTYNPSEQIKWYDAKWFDWYDALSPELQSKVNLPVFSDWDTNNRIWFECYNSMRPEDQSRVKFLTQLSAVMVN